MNGGVTEPPRDPLHVKDRPPVKSLRGQLTRASMLTTLIALLCSAAALLVYELSTYRTTWIADLRTQADLIAHSTATSLEFNDPRTARENLAILHLQPRIRVAVVYDEQGRLYASYAATPADELPRQLDPRLLATGLRFTGSTIELLYPIQHGSERVGLLYLRAQHDLWPRVRGYAAILVLVIATTLVLAYYVFGRLQSRVTTPLLRMAEVAREVMTRRDWSLRAPETEYHDVSVLVQAFNGMLSECEIRTGELEQEMVERKHAEQELRRLDRRKDEFLATLAHELRNPLAPMTSAVALLRLPAATPAVRERAVVILQRQLQHLVRLIDDLLDVSRITTGKLSLHRQRIDLRVLLGAAVDTAQSMALQHGLALTLGELPVELPVEGDGARLAQVFSNLLNNACRYTPSGGRIEVRARTDGGGVEISFQDTGIGIDPAMQQRIFELFEQADKSLERGNAGLGIGLTLARQLVQLHDGEISVRSAGLGQGSCFVVRLPLAAPAPQAVPVAPVPPADEPAGPAAAAAGLRLLIADDNVDFTATLGVLLRTLGHEVEVVDDGAAALQAIQSRPPDIALMDIGMPRMNGYEVARHLRADPALRHVRLVAITGWGQLSDKDAARQAGFDRHLVKPVSPEVLIEVIGELSRSVRLGPSRLTE